MSNVIQAQSGRRGDCPYIGFNKSITVKVSHSYRIMIPSGGASMKKRILIALIVASFAGRSFAADWPITAAPQLYRPGPLLPFEWTGLYFGVNAGYGWARGSSTTLFTGSSGGGSTTPLGLGSTELSTSDVLGSSNPRGGIAGGQIGYSWQAGMIVFGPGPPRSPLPPGPSWCPDAAAAGPSACPKRSGSGGCGPSPSPWR